MKFAGFGIWFKNEWFKNAFFDTQPEAESFARSNFLPKEKFFTIATYLESDKK